MQQIWARNVEKISILDGNQGASTFTQTDDRTDTVSETELKVGIIRTSITGQSRKAGYRCTARSDGAR
jgi:hypothetical protein